MTQYVIRSMSTTDYRIGKYAQESTPFHIYLLKPEHRAGAYWSAYTRHTMVFDSVDDALVHGAAALRDERFDVVPRVDLDVPTYWDARRGSPGARVIGTEIVRRPQ